MTWSHRKLELFHLRAQTYVAATNILLTTAVSILGIYFGIELSKQASERETAKGHFDVSLTCVTGFVEAEQAVPEQSAASRLHDLGLLLRVMPPECRELPQMRLLVATTERALREAARPVLRPQPR